MSPPLRLLAGLLGCAAAVAASMGWTSAAGALEPVSVGVDTSLADTVVYEFDCRGQGEVFVADDTLIASVSVWRPALPDSDAGVRYLFITECSEDGFPITLPGHRLWASPPQVHQVGDGVHPVEYRYDFNPPFSLPKRGKYFLLVQSAAFEFIPILEATHDPYPGGGAWHTGPEYDCLPGSPHAEPPDLDLVFTIVFLRDTATPARRMSWGKLKILYR